MVFFLFLPLSAHVPSGVPAVSGFLCFPLGALGLGALRLLLPPLFCFLVLFCCPAFSATLCPLDPFFVFAPLPSPPRHVFLCVLFSFFLFSPPSRTLRAVLCADAFGAPGPWPFWVAPAPPSSPPLFFPPFFCPLSVPLLSRLFSCFRPWVPWASALCPRTPHPPSLSLSLFFCCCFAFPLFPGSGCSWWSWPLLRLAGFLFPPPCAAFCVVCALRAGAVPPPPPQRLLVFCCVSCLVVWCLCLLWAVLCGSWHFAVFLGALWCWCCAVWCVVVLCSAVFCRAWGRSTLLCGLLCCVLSLAVSSGRSFPLFLLVSCGALLCRAALCGVLSFVVTARVVVWCVVLCVVLVRGVVWSWGPPRCVWFSCLAPPLLLLPPVAVAWPLVPARCCVLSWGAVLRWSVVPSVVRCAAVCVVSCWCCPVASFALAGAVCGCLWLLGVRCWVWLPAVVFR